MTIIFFKSPSEFRKWLEANHASAGELWVGYYKKSSAKKSLTWPESVDQALCFGWIDGIRKNIDELSYKIRFTPRKSTSVWSSVNIKRATDLTNQGLMHAAGLEVILCVGETLEEREANRTEQVLNAQISAGLAGITAEMLARIVVAYEPVWAIGTGRNATPDQAQQAHAFLRRRVKELISDKAAQELIIQYGGSVKPDNAALLLGQPDVDGALVGGASLNAEQFLAIIKAGQGIAK